MLSRSKYAYLYLAIGLVGAFLLMLMAVSWDSQLPFRTALVRPLPAAVRYSLFVDPNAPIIQRWAEAIRQLSDDPAVRAAYAVETVNRRVIYRSDEEVWGYTDHLATPTEMEAKRVAMGWSDIREDCDGQAIMLASLLRALEIPARVSQSGFSWSPLRGGPDGHAWVTAIVGGIEGDLLTDGPSLKLPHVPIRFEGDDSHPAAILGLSSFLLREIDQDDVRIPQPELRLWPIAYVWLLAFLLVWIRRTLMISAAVCEEQGGDA